jgi:PAS domain S-box-containing protein
LGQGGKPSSMHLSMRRRRTAPIPLAELLSNLRTADGLFVTDAEQVIQHWSPQAERILGVPAAEAVGRTCFEVMVGHDSEGQPFCRSDCPVTRNARKHRPVKDYEIVVERNGRRQVINNSVLLWPEEKGRAVVHLFRRARATALPASRSLRKPREAGALSHSPLSRRELEVLRLLASGLRTAAIAEALGVSVFTARNHLSSVMRKLNVRSRVEAVVAASEFGLV